MLKRILYIFILFSFISCEKHLDEKIFKNGDILVKWYRVSAISTVHDHVDLERWGYSENILKSNTGGIYDVKIDKDTVTIRILPGLLIYDLIALKHNCHVKIDSTVTKYDYMKKFQPKNAKYYVGQ